MLRLFSPPHLQEAASLLAQANSALSGLVFATSGTTGAPKWILHAEEGLDWCARTVNAHFACSSRDVWGLALPEFHVGGYCLTHRARLAGGRLARFPHKWQPEAFLHFLQQEKVTVTSLVPTQVHDLAQASLTAPPELRLALIGGEALEPALAQQARELGWPLIASYGMTETAGLIAAGTRDDDTLRPLPGWQLASDADKRLTITGPGLFTGYLTENGLQPREDPFPTQDRVDLSPEKITLLGRSDDQLKILGELVDLARLRREFAALASPLPATVIALPHPRRGHQLLPVLEAPAVPDGLATAFQTWNAGLPGFSRCQPPIACTPWPRTPVGKTDRQSLIRLLTDQSGNCDADRPGNS
ncbi:AMP-binding protein [Roseibacillus ishigakijimensis]|uniref:AMP-binding protein n=1 Tax=Roseibacillus ishigakijimensis TaxID=454146 RepID=A0A934VMN0_9BACT|nr:AMP-binding protein [Roseibacillus ishigakijimensis]MBK1834125.1 AMP-binding protein [Roseibacillus ishigakijimensis]